MSELDALQEVVDGLKCDVDGLIARFHERGRRISQLENELALAESEVDRLRENSARTEGVSWPD